ncbi:hypothetical protein ACHAO7_011240 [Fusarium culmorum]
MKYFGLAKTEREVLSRFSAFGYLAGVAEIPGLDVSLQNVGLKSPTKTPRIPGSNGFLSSGSPGQFLLGVGFDKIGYTVDDAENVTFPYLSNHVPYDLHVSSEDIRKGFYAKLLGLEGYLNTYWTGDVFARHNSGLIWKWNDVAVLTVLKKDLGL